MESEVLADDLAAGHKDFIALYVSLIGYFTSFIQWHVQQAGAAGVTPKELRESVCLGADLSEEKDFVPSILTVVTENIEPLKDKIGEKGGISR